MTEQRDIIQKAIDKAGSVRALARSGGFGRPSIYRWLAGERVSPETAIRLENVTDGAVTRQELRPDMWPDPPPEREAR